jgi:hypothetical protein
MLTDLQHATLAFENLGWTDLETHDQLARDLFDRTPTRQAQVVNALLDNPDALAAYPQLVRRLRRLRGQHRSSLPPVRDRRQTINRFRTRGVTA